MNHPPVLPLPRAVLWDKDGTLADSFSAWVEIESKLALRLGTLFLPPGPAAETYKQSVMTGLGVGPEGQVSARGVLASGTEETILGVFYSALEPLAPVHPPWLAFRYEARKELANILKESPPQVRPTSGALACLEFLDSQGIAQGLATSDTQSNARRDLGSLGLDRFLRFWACGDTALKPKPDPWSVQAFAQEWGLSAAQITVVGDTPADLELAQSAGAGFAALLCGTGRREDFPPDTVLFENPGALADFWKSLH